MKDRRQRRARLFALLAVAVASTLIWLLWQAGAAPEPRGATGNGTTRSAAPPLSAIQATGGAKNHDTAAAGAKLADPSDPAGGALDLKRVFDDYIGSADPRQRRMAVRAFEACVPAFLSGAGQSPSPEPLIEALPSDHRAEREAAYRALFARCHRLLADGRASLDGTWKMLARDAQNQAPGQRAQEAVLAGRVDLIEPMVAEALSGVDPAAVESLAGLAARLVSMRQPEGADAATQQRAREVDAALPWVACDLGLDCDAQSLRALQLCAAEGLCEGDVAVRLTVRMAPGSVDPDAVQQQRARLLGLIRGGRTLGTADLLP
jgi:hypothetical protein